MDSVAGMGKGILNIVAAVWQGKKNCCNVVARNNVATQCGGFCGALLLLDA